MFLICGLWYSETPTSVKLEASSIKARRRLQCRLVNTFADAVPGIELSTPLAPQHGLGLGFSCKPRNCSNLQVVPRCLTIFFAFVFLLLGCARLQRVG